MIAGIAQTTRMTVMKPRPASGMVAADPGHPLEDAVSGGQLVGAGPSDPGRAGGKPTGPATDQDHRSSR